MTVMALVNLYEMHAAAERLEAIQEVLGGEWEKGQPEPRAVLRISGRGGGMQVDVGEPVWRNLLRKEANRLIKKLTEGGVEPMVEIYELDPE